MLGLKLSKKTYCPVNKKSCFVVSISIGIDLQPQINSQRVLDDCHIGEIFAQNRISSTNSLFWYCGEDKRFFPLVVFSYFKVD